jgi:hypothetical protein
MSLRHEISAQIHHYYFYKKRNKNYNKIFEIVEKLNSFNIKELSGEELDEIEFIKNKICSFILNLKISKKYKKDLNKSIWNEKDNDIFLSKLKDIFSKSAKYIEKKIKQVDSKVILSKKLMEKSTIPTAFERKDYLDFYYHDPIIDLFKDAEDYF